MPLVLTNSCHRTGTPSLGRATSIPWDIAKIPRYIATFPPEAIDTAVLAFEYHCKLLELQQRYLDVM